MTYHEQPKDERALNRLAVVRDQLELSGGGECLPLSLPSVTLPSHEVVAVPVQKGTVQNRVASVQVDVGAHRHRPVLVVAQEEVLALLVRELALDTLAPADAFAERGQQLLLSIPVTTMYSWDHVSRYGTALWSLYKRRKKSKWLSPNTYEMNHPAFSIFPGCFKVAAPDGKRISQVLK